MTGYIKYFENGGKTKHYSKKKALQKKLLFVFAQYKNECKDTKI